MVTLRGIVIIVGQFRYRYYCRKISSCVTKAGERFPQTSVEMTLRRVVHHACLWTRATHREKGHGGWLLGGGKVPGKFRFLRIACGSMQRSLRILSSPLLSSTPIPLPRNLHNATVHLQRSQLEMNTRLILLLPL